MISFYEKREEIIKIINNGFDIELIAFEFDIPIEKLQEYKNRLELRKFAKKSVGSKRINVAIKKLTEFVQENDDSLVERTMLLKLKAYLNSTKLSEEEVQKIEEERKQQGLFDNIDTILEELDIQIPVKKSKNIKNKKKQNTDEVVKADIKKEISKELSKEEHDFQEERNNSENDIKTHYEKLIEKYKEEIGSIKENQNGMNNILELEKRNLLAFAYFKAGKTEEAKEELNALIKEKCSYVAYRQMVYLEKVQGNFEQAKLVAYKALKDFPNSREIREQLISIAELENNKVEVIRRLKEIGKLYPENDKVNKRLRELGCIDER